MTLEDFFERYDTDDIATIAGEIEAGEVADERVDELRELIEDTEDTVVEDAIRDRPDPDFAALAWNRLRAAVGLDERMFELGELGGGESIEEVPEEQAEDLERLREIMFAGPLRFTEEQLNDVRRAIEADDLDMAPASVRAPLRRLDDEGLDQILSEVRAALDDIVGGLIGEAEEGRGRGRMDAFPEIQRLTDRRGQRLGWFRDALRELRGEAPADRLPADELAELQRQRATRQQFIEKVERHIAQLEAQQAEGPRGRQRGFGGFGTGPIGAGAEARRIVPAARRRDPTTGEEWTASDRQIELERSFMEFVLQVKPNRNRWDSGTEFRKQPGNRVREMEEWAWLMVKAGNASVSDAVKKGLPEEWFQGL